jgi:hypothetical protein
MPSKLDPYVATIEGWLAADPHLTALAIVGRLSERHAAQFGKRQHSIVKRSRVLRRANAPARPPTRKSTTELSVAKLQRHTKFV